MGLKRSADNGGTNKKPKVARVVSVRAETPVEAEPSAQPAPARLRARIYQCNWCGRNLRSRKLIRTVVHAGEVPWKSPIGEHIIAGTFLCQPTCYLAWMNQSGQLRYDLLFSQCELPCLLSRHG